ncbi:TPA: hypothetical protein ACPP6G_001717 [Haemophilus influenzae]
MTTAQNNSGMFFKVENALPLAQINTMRERISSQLQANYGLEKSRA